MEWADVALGLQEPGGEVTASAATWPECPVKGCRGRGGPPRGPPVLAAGRTAGEWRAQAWESHTCARPRFANKCREDVGGGENILSLPPASAF